MLRAARRCPGCAQAAAKKLGFLEQSWDVSALIPPFYDQLSTSQQAAVSTLGYDAEDRRLVLVTPSEMAWEYNTRRETDVLDGSRWLTKPLKVHS